jgi:outer membrane protein OmpA-like peptidoglycan-associated protein
VKGTFKYEGLAKEGVKLELLDENNKVIETIYTDENGNFIFSKLAKESSYIVRLSDGERSMIDQSSFQFINENDEYLEQAGMTETGFQFKTLPRSEESMSGKLASDNTSLNARSFLPKDKASSSTSKKPMITSKSTSGSSANPMEDKNDLKLKTIFFNFNSIRLSNNDCYNLTHKVYQKASRSGQPILILGYSCDLGSPAVNNAISKMRAEEVKKYLVNLGIDPDRIETEVITSEEAEKMTYGERLENRKVEVYHLTP